MNYYLAMYYDGKRWRLITRELSTDKTVVKKQRQFYENNGYKNKTKLKTINLA